MSDLLSQDAILSATASQNMCYMWTPKRDFINKTNNALLKAAPAKNSSSKLV